MYFQEKLDGESSWLKKTDEIPPLEEIHPFQQNCHTFLTSDAILKFFDIQNVIYILFISYCLGSIVKNIPKIVNPLFTVITCVS